MSFSICHYLTSRKNYDLENKVTILRFDKGKYIYKPMSAEARVFEVISGAVKVGFTHDSGKEIITDFHLPGEVFGRNISHVDDYLSFAKALTNVEVCIYNRHFFDYLVSCNITICDWYQIFRSKKLEKIERRLHSLYAEDIDNRIINLRRSLASIKVMEDSFREVSIFDLLTQQDIAHLANTTRQKVAKVLNTVN